MGSNYISHPDPLIREEDTRVIAAEIGYATFAELICSYSMSGKQLLDELQSRLRTVSMGTEIIHTHFDGKSLVIDELGKNAFIAEVIESPEDHFAAVVAIFVPMLSDENDAEWSRYGDCAIAVLLSLKENKVGIPDCVVADLEIDNAGRRTGASCEGFYFPNADLADVFRRSRQILPPYDTQLLPGEYEIPVWFKSFQYTSANTEHRQATSSSNSSVKVGTGGGCYVATAVYGSYDCPEVWTLRRFRDYDLAESWYGRIFIRVYYAVSPAIVHWFGKMEWFQRFWRDRLDTLVKKLRDQGYEDGPYQDKNWR